MWELRHRRAPGRPGGSVPGVDSRRNPSLHGGVSGEGAATHRTGDLATNLRHLILSAPLALAVACGGSSSNPSPRTLDDATPCFSDLSID